MIVDFLANNLKVSAKGYAGLAGQAYRPLDIFLNTHPLENFQWKNVPVDIINHIRSTPWPQLQAEIKQGYELAMEQKDDEKDKEVEYTEFEKQFLEPFVIAQTVTSGGFFLWDKNSRMESDWSPSVIKTRLRPQAWAKACKESHLTRFVFNPYDIRAVTQTYENDLPVTVCNRYRPPIWQTENLVADKNKTLPEIFNVLQIKLFPIPAEREIVLDWLCLALYSRPISFLSLRGNRGTGKSIWKQIIYHLIGNFVEAQDDVLSKFTAYIRHKRILGVDDKDIMGSQKGNSFRKHILNPMMTYEEKFEKVGGSETNYISLMICSNPGNALYVEWDERRIVSPTMGVEKMESWCNPAVFSWLAAYETEDSTTLSEAHILFLREIGECLWTRWQQKQPDANIQLKSGYFWLDVVRSLPAFKKYLVEEVLADIQNPTIDYEEVRTGFKLANRGGIVAHWQTVRNWLLGDFELWGVKLAIEADNETKTLTVNPAFVSLVLKQRGK